MLSISRPGALPVHVFLVEDLDGVKIDHLQTPGFAVAGRTMTDAFCSRLLATVVNGTPTEQTKPGNPSFIDTALIAFVALFGA